MDSKNYIYAKMKDSFNTIYNINNIEVGQVTQNTKPSQSYEKFNSLDKQSIDNAINNYNFTLRQTRANMN